MTRAWVRKLFIMLMMFMFAGSTCERSQPSERRVWQAQDTVVPALSAEEEVALFESARLQQNRLQLPWLEMNGYGDCSFVAWIPKAPPAGTVVLTFDDGPHPSRSPFVLEVLRKYSIQATFFWVGQHASRFPDLLTRAKSEGHLVASHSVSHPNFHGLTEAQQQFQIIGAEPSLKSVMTDIKLFRYPFGNSTCESNSLLRSRGYGLVGWHVDSCDWAFEATGRVTEQQAKICAVSGQNRDRFVDHVIEGVEKRRGGILLLHDSRRISVENLEEIIVKLLQKGYRFTNLDDPRYLNDIQ